MHMGVLGRASRLLDVIPVGIRPSTSLGVAAATDAVRPPAQNINN